MATLNFIAAGVMALLFLRKAYLAVEVAKKQPERGHDTLLNALLFLALAVNFFANPVGAR